MLLHRFLLLNAWLDKSSGKMCLAILRLGYQLPGLVIGGTGIVSLQMSLGQMLEVVLPKPQSDRKPDGANIHNSGLVPNYIPNPGFGGFPGNPYAAPVGAGYGVAAGYQQQECRWCQWFYQMAELAMFCDRAQIYKLTVTSHSNKISLQQHMG